APLRPAPPVRVPDRNDRPRPVPAQGLAASVALALGVLGFGLAWVPSLRLVALGLAAVGLLTGLLELTFRLALRHPPAFPRPPPGGPRRQRAGGPPGGACRPGCRPRPRRRAPPRTRPRLRRRPGPVSSRSSGRLPWPTPPASWSVRR